jgi:hypothetical protein
MPNHVSAQVQRTVGPKYQLSNGFNEVDGEISFTYFERNTTSPTGSTLFDGTTTTANIVNGDVIYAARLKKGMRILGGRLLTEDLGASVTIKVGTVENDAAFLAATSVASASSTLIASTLALGCGSVLAQDTWLILTVAGANPTLAKGISGWIEYAKN